MHAPSHLPAAGKLDSLSARECQVLELVATGASNVEIAASLDLSLHTIKRHVSRVIHKLSVTSRSEAASHYRQSVTDAAHSILERCEAHDPAALRTLTKREWDVLTHIAAGANSERIAFHLALSVNTVNRHTAKIFSKLGVNGRVAAAALAHNSTVLDALPKGNPDVPGWGELH